MSEALPYVYKEDGDDDVVTPSSSSLTNDQRHSITHAFIRNDVIAIKPQAFQNCDHLVEVIFSQQEGVSRLQSIYTSAFEGCSALEYVSFPCTLQTIGKYAFRQCINLTELEFHNHSNNTNDEKLRMLDIGIKAFEGCRSLCAISFPQSKHEITVGYQAFANCSSLLGVEIPSSSSLLSLSDSSSTTTIIKFGQNVFQGCHALVNVSIPMTSMMAKKCRPERSFFMCSSLKKSCYPACDFPEALIDRYYNLPLHHLCYHAASTSTTTTKLKDLHVLMDTYDKYDAVDRWGMTAYHILATTAKLRADWIMTLLLIMKNRQSSSLKVILKKDRNDKTMLDYLILHKSNASTIVFQKVLKRLLAIGMEGWGIEEWRLDMLALVGLYGRQEGTATRTFHPTTPRKSAEDGGGSDDEGDDEMVESDDSTSTFSGGCWEERMRLRHASFDAITRRLAAYGRKEVTSLMEQALWKMRTKSSASMNRVDCRWSCGSDFVIPQVMDYLWHHSEPSGGLMYLNL